MSAASGAEAAWDFGVSSISLLSYQRDSFACVCGTVWHGAPLFGVSDLHFGSDLSSLSV